MKAIKLAAALAVAFAATGASAATITFNELAFDGYYTPVNPVTSGGYTFNNDCGQGSPCLGVWGKNSPYQSDPGFASVFVNYGNTTTTMQQVGGGAFDFFSIDLADVYNQGSVVTLQFTFNHNGGGATSQFVTLDNTPGLQTFVFGESNLDSVTWRTTSGANGWNQFDNVNTTPAVPEPETYALMLAGLGVVGLLARRRRAV